MALCLASSLIVRRDFVLYDQLVRYKWWYRKGYMSSTGQCFDIGAATRESLEVFEKRQVDFAKHYDIHRDIDYLSDSKLLDKFDVNCSRSGVAGNGALMRLAPIPLFFYRHPSEAVKFCGQSAKITHGDEKAVDACRYYGALIVAALQGSTKSQILHEKFYSNHKKWFNDEKLCPDIKRIAKGSFKKSRGYEDGIRGSGYIVNALEAALWAFWSDHESFYEGVLLAVNLGDDTDTTAAIYGQLAGAYYGYRNLPSQWVHQVYARKFILNISNWIGYQGNCWKPTTKKNSSPKNDSKSSIPTIKMSGTRKPSVNDYPREASILRLSPIQTNGQNELKPNPLKLRKTISTPSGDEYHLAQPRTTNKPRTDMSTVETQPVTLAFDRPLNPRRVPREHGVLPSYPPVEPRSRYYDENAIRLKPTQILRTNEPPTGSYATTVNLYPGQQIRMDNHWITTTTHTDPRQQHYLSTNGGIPPARNGFITSPHGPVYNSAPIQPVTTSHRNPLKPPLEANY